MRCDLERCDGAIATIGPAARTSWRQGWWGGLKTRENKVLEVEAGVEVEDEGSGLGGAGLWGGVGGRMKEEQEQ